LEVKGRGGEGVHVDAGALKSVF